MTTGKKAGTILLVPKRQVAKPSSARDYITSRAGKITETKFDVFYVRSDVT
jgi:hypothetical protein